MSGKPINLRLARKRKAREAAEKQADSNRVLHGAPKAQRDLAKARAEAETKALDGKTRGE